MCLVLASHIGHGWKGWDRGAVSCMSFSLWQGKDCWDGRLCEVVILGMAYDAGMKLILAFVFLFWLYFYFNFFCRLAAEINVERKKGQKAKSKSSEGRKQLSSVRVIQRNLVYIVGLPLNLADEDVVPLSLSLSVSCVLGTFGWVLWRSTWPLLFFSIFYAASPAPWIFWSVW